MSIPTPFEALDNTRSGQKHALVDDGGTQHAACDQCRARKIKCDRKQPQCSNCLKSGAVCGVERSAKRINHTKELRGEFSVVLEHLASFEQRLDSLTNYTRQIASNSTELHRAPASEAIHSLAGRDRPDRFPWSGYQAQRDDPRSDGPGPERVSLGYGGEICYGYPSPMSLVMSLFRQATDALGPSNEPLGRASDGVWRGENTLKNTLREKMLAFPLSPHCDDSPIGSDGEPIAYPPRAVLSRCLDRFLEDINSVSPVFDPPALRRAVEKYYDGETTIGGTAWALILNNIAILQLRLEVLSGKRSDELHHDVANHLITSLLVNCNRALDTLELFCRPILVNIQALATLTLVAREFFHSSVSERVCEVTCQTARTFGIHRIPQSPNPIHRGRGLSAEDSPEHQHRLFKTLYVFDKQRVLMTGKPSDLYLFDASVPATSASHPKTEEGPDFSAHFDLMVIWEEIYLRLYTPKALAASGSSRALHIPLIQGQLEEWHRGRGAVIDTVDSSREHRHWAIELKYCYHVLRMLLFRWGDQDQTYRRGKPNEYFDDSRMSLGLIAQFQTIPVTTSSMSSLCRVVRNLPSIAFLELVSFHIKAACDSHRPDASIATDFALLKAAHATILTLANSSLPQAYYARLAVALTWALDVIAVIRDAGTHGQTGNLISGLDPPGPSPERYNRAIPDVQGSNGTTRPSPTRQGGITLDTSGYNPAGLGLDIFEGLRIPGRRSY